MSRWQAYHTPATVSEALSLLHQHKDKARIIAGGTDCPAPLSRHPRGRGINDSQDI